MRKIILILAVFIINSSQLFAAKSFDGKISYSEATDVFVLMDYVSGYRFGEFHEYQNSWKKKFPFTLEDKNMFNRYKEIRAKYEERKELSIDQDKLLFSHVFIPQFDKIADAFYTSKSVGQALIKLRVSLEADDVKFLASFYTHFQNKISSYVKESTHFNRKLKTINKHIKSYKVRGLLKKFSKFLNIPKGRMNFKLLFVWWPSDRMPRISYGHNVILLHYNPIQHTDKIDVPRIAQTLVRYMLFRQTINSKENLSKRFFNDCKIKLIDSVNILERPMMVLWGKILLEKQKAKKKDFNLYQSWDQNPWINTYAKMLYPVAEKSFSKKENIAVSFIQDAAKICKELNQLSNYLQIKK